MWSPMLAIGWELWGRNRLGIAATAAGLAVVGAVAALLPARSAEPALLLGTVYFAIAALYLLSVVLHAEFHEGSFRLGLPRRLFRLPVRIAALVAWLMTYGVVALAVLWLATSAVVWLPAGVEPAWWVVPLLAVAVVWFQAICWAVPGPPLAKIFAACVTFPALKFALEMLALVVVLFVNGEPRVDQEAVIRARPVVLTVFAGAFIPLAYLVAVVGAARARRGADGWPRLELPTVVAPERRSAPFRSAGRAQLWFEWHRKGYLLPLFPVGFLAFLTAVVSPVVGTRELVTAVAVMVALVVVVAFFVGYGFGKTSFWAEDLRLPVFQCTRPLGSGDLAMAKLRAAGLSALAATAVVVVGVPLWLGLLGRAGEVAAWLSPRAQGLDGPRLVALATLAAVGLFTLTWGQIVGGLVPSLTGRTWVVNGVVAAYLAITAGLGLLAKHVHENPDALEPSVTALSWSCRSLVGVKLVAAGWVLWAALRRGLLTGRAVAAVLAAWGAGVGCLVVLAGWLLPAEGRTLGVAAVLFVPLVRPLAAPLAVAWNRHR